MLIEYRTIGIIEIPPNKSPVADKTASNEALIVLDPPLAEGLKGLKPGQRIEVIFHFHRTDGFELCQHPRGNRLRAKRGVFALRSPRRPNPIGLSEVEVVGIKDNVIRVKDLDALDCTPVLDIKPA
jgi:tRNA-Thr(GGU) m(6)t(6)A37 methyltransferase TsaA